MLHLLTGKVHEEGTRVKRACDFVFVVIFALVDELIKITAFTCRQSWTGCLHNQNKLDYFDLSPAIYTAHWMVDERKELHCGGDWMAFREYTDFEIVYVHF